MENKEFKRRSKSKKQITDNSALIEFQNNQAKLLQNYLNRIVLSRVMSADMGTTHEGKRDIYSIFGYKRILDFQDYFWRYDRQDIATRIVSAFPEASWALKPEICDKDTPDEVTPFEEQIKDLITDRNVFHYLTRADILAGIGRYGVIMLGFNDGKKADKPVVKKKGMKLLYMRPYSEGSVKIVKLNGDTKSDRYGLPDMYEITQTINVDGTTTEATNVTNMKVHWSRVQHILPDDLGENDVFGMSRLNNVYNRLQDLDLIAAGGAEAFFRGAYPGMAFKADGDTTMDPEDRIALEQEIDDYVNDYKRYIKLKNIDVTQLESKVASPKDAADLIITLISAAKGIPKRILTGSERGELASSQDSKAWNERVGKRRTDKNELMILRPFIDKMIAVGVLSEPDSKKYDVKWPDLFQPSVADKAKTAESAMRALKDYGQTPGAELILPVELFLTRFLSMTNADIKWIDKNVAGEYKSELDDLDIDNKDLNIIDDDLNGGE